MVEGVPGVVDLGVAAGGVSIGLPAPLLGVTDELTAGVSPCCWACRVCPVSYTHLTLPTTGSLCRSRWSPYH